jgi:hypothetical protein
MQNNNEGDEDDMEMMEDDSLSYGKTSSAAISSRGGDTRATSRISNQS